LENQVIPFEWDFMLLSALVSLHFERFMQDDHHQFRATSQHLIAGDKLKRYDIGH